MSALTSVKLADYNEIPENQGECTICLDTLEPGNSTGHACSEKVHHIFHKTCIKKWIEEKESCPLCKRPIDVGLSVKKILKTSVFVGTYLLCGAYNYYTNPDAVRSEYGITGDKALTGFAQIMLIYGLSKIVDLLPI